MAVSLRMGIQPRAATVRRGNNLQTTFANRASTLNNRQSEASSIKTTIIIICVVWTIVAISWSYCWSCECTCIVIVLGIVSSCLLFVPRSAVVLLVILLCAAISIPLTISLCPATHNKCIYVYGSIVRIDLGGVCRLYSSYDHLLPVNYVNGDQSTHQQIISCKTEVSVNDSNDQWYLLHPVDGRRKREVICDGCIVMLVHVNSGRMLTTQPVRGPLTQWSHEVSGYIDFHVNHHPWPYWQLLTKCDEKCRVILRHLSGPTLYSTMRSLSSLLSGDESHLEVVASKSSIATNLSQWNVNLIT